MLSFGMKYPEKRKKAPRTVQMRELPEMKSGDTALKKSTKELAMSVVRRGSVLIVTNDGHGNTNVVLVFF